MGKIVLRFWIWHEQDVETTPVREDVGRWPQNIYCV